MVNQTHIAKQVIYKTFNFDYLSSCSVWLDGREVSDTYGYVVTSWFIVASRAKHWGYKLFESIILKCPKSEVTVPRPQVEPQIREYG